MKFFNPSLLLLIRVYIPDDERFPENGDYDNLSYSEYDNDNDNDDNLPYAEYPGSPIPPIYRFCLSPAQSFPMTAGY